MPTKPKSNPKPRRARDAVATAPQKKVSVNKPTAAVHTEQPPQTKNYMSPSQQKWFRTRLEKMLTELQEETEKTAEGMRKQEKGLADELDRAHNEFAFVVDLRENERMSNLQEKINHALRLLESNIYGICEDCREQIGIQRMAARPVATKCIDCKQFQERMEQYIG